jgi:hypothetical protein
MPQELRLRIHRQKLGFTVATTLFPIADEEAPVIP